MSTLVGLPVDHPLFPSRITLVVETWLAFAYAGVGHAVGVTALTSLLRLFDGRAWETRWTSTATLCVVALGAWTAFSAPVAADYRLHYRHNVTFAQCLSLQFVHLGGYLLTQRALAQHTATYLKPLFYLSPNPSLVPSVLYGTLVLWLLAKWLPQMTVVSPSGLTLPKFLARNVGIPFEVLQDMHRMKNAAPIMRQWTAMESILQRPYTYAPLRAPRTIRLLRLESRGKEMKCCLETVNLDEAPDFWAVSYLWGSEVKPLLLKITDEDGREIGYVPITMNCGAAVLALVPMGVRRLWIDAVCIDQANPAEKQHQIPLMGEIYSRASLVVGHISTENEVPIGLLVQRMVQILGRKQYLNMQTLTSNIIFHALSELFRHEYFERVWILQEIVLARPLVVMYGKDCMYFDHLLLIAKEQYKNSRISSGAPLLPLAADRTSQIWSDAWQHLSMSIAKFAEQAMIAESLRINLRTGEKPTVAQIVDQNPAFGATKPRDRIYAMLSLACDSGVDVLQPNYSFDVSDREIFTRVSAHYLCEGSRVSLLLSSGLPTPLTLRGTPSPARTPGIPSWVYDFATGPSRGLRTGSWAAEMERSRPVTLTCRPFAGQDSHGDTERICIRGTIIGRIAACAAAPSSSLLHDSSHLNSNHSTAGQLPLRVMESAIASIIESTRTLTHGRAPDPYPGGMSRHEAYWRTMLMDRFFDTTPAPASAAGLVDMVRDLTPQVMSGHASSFTSTARRSHPALDGLEPEQAQAAIQAMMDLVFWVWMAYAFISLESGHLGWAPLGVVEGDVLCLFEGCIVPFVLRPTSSGSKVKENERVKDEDKVAADLFQLVGDGYVQGFMPGQESSMSLLPLQWITLV